MNWCKPHWDQLRKAIDERGLSQFVAGSGKEAMQNFVTDLEGGEAPFDPLIGCWNRINGVLLQTVGLRLLNRCPLCILVEDKRPELVQKYIDGASDEALKYAVDKGLITTQ